MARMNVNPTRMELKKLKGRLKTAQRGHKLLKDKTDEMIRRFSVLVRETARLRAEVESGEIRLIVRDHDMGKFLARKAFLEELTEKLEKYHLEKEVIRPKSENTIKKFRKQHLTTDTGIEITIPMEEYKNPDRVEFLTNPDGTVSVLIKNIGRLRSK